MEIKEAVKFLKKYTDDEVYTCKCLTSHSMAISALERQISMKPVFVHPLQFDDCGDYMCSSCQKGSVLDPYGNKSDYCHYCGQKLDWSDL